MLKKIIFRLAWIGFDRAVVSMKGPGSIYCYSTLKIKHDFVASLCWLHTSQNVGATSCLSWKCHMQNAKFRAEKVEKYKILRRHLLMICRLAVVSGVKTPNVSKYYHYRTPRSHKIQRKTKLEDVQPIKRKPSFPIIKENKIKSFFFL